MFQTSPIMCHDDAMLEADFWRGQFPELTINASLSPETLAYHRPEEPLMRDIEQRILEEGYFQEEDPGIETSALVLGQTVKRCVALGLPPTFLFLFDQPWACFYRQHRVFSRLIGEDYRILPDFWIWHVNPQTQESGWSPHRDKGRRALAKDGSPLSLTMWIPLSEATPLNSCIHLVPADRDGVYNTPLERHLQVELGNIRALPAKPGQILCWNQAVLHWGSRSHKRAQSPRLSMALEFQRGDVEPFNKPLLTPLEDISFQSRLKLVAKQILQYTHMYALSPEIQSLAERIQLL